jgi:arylsulfatase A-like enzyme
MSKPNIIFIVADDLGYADLGCYGGRDAAFGKVSPVLDGLAANGLKFTDGYSNSPVCSPTRFAMISARYQYRFRGAAEEPINSASKGSETLGMPGSHPTLPSLLRESGYSTALFGKWHLGYPPTFGPIKSGYDEYFGPMSGGVDYFTHCNGRGVHDFFIGEEEKHVEGYLTDLISNRAVDYIKQAKAASEQKPFFLSLHYTAPHWPWETREDHALAEEVKNNLFHLHGGNVATYQKMIHQMDEGIGWIVQALKETGQLENTLIVFTSDNGGERFSDNWPHVGGKMDLTEGGIRVPYIAYWPKVIKPGRVSNQQCLTMDWSATMIAAGQGKPDPKYPLDGVSLLPVLADQGNEFERPLFWRMNHRGQRAARLGPWKYLRVDDHDYLFNLEQDGRERANLGTRDPERLASMSQSWEQWNATMPAIPSDATVSLGYTIKDMPAR